jgi:hypothetical protein
LEWQRKEDENSENIINGRIFSLRNEIKNYRSSMQLNNKLTLWNSFNQIIKCDNFKSNNMDSSGKNVLKILSEDIKIYPNRNKYHNVKTEIADIHFKCKSQVNNYKCKYSSFIKKNIEVSRITKLTIEKKRIKNCVKAIDTSYPKASHMGKSYFNKTPIDSVKDKNNNYRQGLECCLTNFIAMPDQEDLLEGNEKAAMKKEEEDAVGKMKRT